MTKTKYEEAASVVKHCLADDEDGSGYLFDEMKGEVGTTVLEALELADALNTNGVEIKAVSEMPRTTVHKVPEDVRGPGCFGIMTEFGIEYVSSAFLRIRQWAEARNLVTGATSQAQMLKMTEEVGELAHGIARGDKAEIKDAIGDCVVVLTILAAQNGMLIEDCIESAYNEIKDRKGKMVNGVFVKEAE